MKLKHLQKYHIINELFLSKIENETIHIISENNTSLNIMSIFVIDAMWKLRCKMIFYPPWIRWRTFVCSSLLSLKFFTMDDRLNSMRSSNILIVDVAHISQMMSQWVCIIFFIFGSIKVTTFTWIYWNCISITLLDSKRCFNANNIKS